MDHISAFVKDFSSTGLEDKIEFELNGVINREIEAAFQKRDINLCIEAMDYTSLKVTDSDASIAAFVKDLREKLVRYRLPSPASVCVYPRFAKIVKAGLEGTSIHTTVVAACFPTSQTFIDVKTAECRCVINEGADEVDVVISVGALLAGDYQTVYEELCAIREATSGHLLKVILETGEINRIPLIFDAALIACKAGADFVKTSTGKVPINATPEAVYAMCEAVRQYHQKSGRKVGIKVAGGVSHIQSAVRYAAIVNHILGETWTHPSLFRIGTSSLLGDVINFVSKEL